MNLANLPSPAWAKLNPEELRKARLLRTLLQVMIAGTLVASVLMLATISPWAAVAIAVVLLSIETAAWLLLRAGHFLWSTWTIVASSWLFLVAATFLGRDQGILPFFGLVMVVAIAGLLLGGRAALVTAVISSLIGVAYLVTAANQALPPAIFTFAPGVEFYLVSLIFFAAAGVTALANRSLTEVQRAAQQNAEAQAQANREIEHIRQALEIQGAERAQALGRRTRYLQAVAEVSRGTATILDPNILLQNAVELIREQFSLYYTGIFLVDPSGEWALLQAGSGEAGQRMLARGHRMRVGSGMVGWSIANAQPRIALDVGRDAVRLATEELPETRSEAAIPLRSRGKVLGAFTVQSSQPQAFGDMEITIFQSLADQLAIALDNARLFRESQQALEQAQQAYRQASGRAWREFLHDEGLKQIRYRYGQIEVLQKGQQMGKNGSAESAGALAVQYTAEQARREVIQSCRPIQRVLDGRATLFLPVLVRDQLIGVIHFAKEPSDHLNDARRDWSQDEIMLLENISTQLGNALDTARLYQDTQKAAAREQITSEATARIRQTLDMQTVLRTAVEEIQRHLNLPEIVISLAGPDEVGGSEDLVEEDEQR